MGAAAMMIPGALSWCLSGGCSQLLHDSTSQGLGALGNLSFGGVRWAVCSIFGPVPPLVIMMTITVYVVTRDTLDGRITGDVVRSAEGVAVSKQTANGEHGPTQLACPLVQGSAPVSGFGWLQRLRLFLMIAHDFCSMGQVTLPCYGLIPIGLACWSLLWKGAQFEYIVGEANLSSLRLPSGAPTT